VTTNDVPSGDGGNVWTVLSPAAHGVVVMSTNGIFSYTPAATYKGPDSFTYQVCDANNDCSSTTVTITVTPGPAQADLAVFKTGPATVLVATNFTYAIMVTNRGFSTATNVVVTDHLPTNLVFVSASAGGVFSSDLVTWPAISALPTGGATSFTLTVNARTSGTFTNIASATSSTPDPNLADNDGTAPASRVITTAALGQFGILIVTNVFTPQTGLYEERVVVTNNTSMTLDAVRVYVTGLRSGVYLQNAVGTNAGKPYVHYNVPLPAGGNVAFLLEFLSVDRRPFTNGIEVEVTTPILFTPATGAPVKDIRIFMETYAPLDEPHQVVEFATVPGRSYMVLYGDAGPDSVTNVAPPIVRATANVVQWVDAGPPKTATKPAARYYRAVLLP
jgi:uncharacterized repeat protein (TIGR01451 family)